jgi:hypothetical protein
MTEFPNTWHHFRLIPLSCHTRKRRIAY